jgi:hypothetical protein
LLAVLIQLAVQDGLKGDCGHSSQIEKPEEFRQTLFGFLRKH